MARIPYVRQEVEVPEGVKVSVEGKRVRVEGPLGSVEKDFSHAKDILISLEDSKVVLEAYFVNKKGYALVNTLASKIRNMIVGVQRGFRYKMKVVYAHFPMSVKVDEERGLVIIENFLGRRDKIQAKIVPGAKVRVEKDDVIVEGVDVEAVAQTAANIHEAARLRGKYRLCPHGREGGPGVLDGIYVYAKEHIK
ncbi:MAG: 50S ribosomal protein L6 [Thermoprotei archaeon]|nr:MAG: 50S ribosomal protein L6 [Thermoprotei archaeon]